MLAGFAIASRVGWMSVFFLDVCQCWITNVKLLARRFVIDMPLGNFSKFSYRGECYFLPVLTAWWIALLCFVFIKLSIEFLLTGLAMQSYFGFCIVIDSVSWIINVGLMKADLLCFVSFSWSAGWLSMFALWSLCLLYYFSFFIVFLDLRSGN